MDKVTVMFHCLKVICVTCKSLDSFKTVLYGWFFLKHVQHVTVFKGSVQWKNDLDLYFSLVLVMNIGMCDLVILCLVYPPQEF